MILKRYRPIWVANKRITHVFFISLTLISLACASVNQDKMNPERYFEGPALELARAIQADQLDEVTRLAKQVDLNRFYKADMTPLIWAMLVDKEASFRLLLKLGANPNLKDREKIQPVALAAGARDNNTYLKILLQNGGDPNSTQRTEPAIHVAFDSEFYKNLDVLLSAGADINAQDEHDDTILIKAGYQNKFDKAIELIEKGADIDRLSDSGGGIALEVQESTPAVGSEAYDAQARLKKILMTRGVKFPVPDPSAKPYSALLDRWHDTPEGHQWQQKRQEIGADPMGFGQRWVEVDKASFAAFKAWMKANHIPEPIQPRPKFIDPNE
ncbi:ankyrin repeat domain-containing protein [Fibrella sp. WM1]|uniref:ankyrin repeat domain-containing protein n=1 Tax=Fibrella musci TaxID=3242485 RepID=UPI003522D5F3